MTFLCAVVCTQLDHVSTKLLTKQQSSASKGSYEGSHCALTRLFPTLEEVFELTDKHLGFAVELKYPVQMKVNGSYNQRLFKYFCCHASFVIINVTVHHVILAVVFVILDGAMKDNVLLCSRTVQWRITCTTTWTGTSTVIWC